jgi:putative transposase
VLWTCRTLYNVALEQRITAWQRRRVSVSRYQQEAGLKDVRPASPEHAVIDSHVLQDALARLDKNLSGVLPAPPARREGGVSRF